MENTKQTLTVEFDDLDTIIDEGDPFKDVKENVASVTPPADPTENALDVALLSDFDMGQVKDEVEQFSNRFADLIPGKYVVEGVRLEKFTAKEPKPDKTYPLYNLIFKVIDGSDELAKGLIAKKAYFETQFKRKEDKNGRLRQPQFWVDMFNVIGDTVPDLKIILSPKNYDLVAGKKFQITSSMGTGGKVNYWINAVKS